MSRISVLFSIFILSTALSYAKPIPQLPPPPVVMVYVTADWCVSCQRMKLVVNSLRLNGYPIIVLDADNKKWELLLDKHRVDLIPCFLMFVDDNLDSRITGWTTEDVLEKWLKSTLKSRFGQKSK